MADQNVPVNYEHVSKLQESMSERVQQLQALLDVLWHLEDEREAHRRSGDGTILGNATMQNLHWLATRLAGDVREGVQQLIAAPPGLGVTSALKAAPARA